jgi:ribosomal 30S subunit maturation factor RimM
VERLIETGARDVLVIGGQNETLIPFVEQFVIEVDMHKRMIRVDWDDD